MIDFTNCRIIPGRVYNGANGSKIAVDWNGEIYMLKFPPSAAGKPTALSYTNSCISEHIASSIFNLVGIRAHETMLGLYTVKNKEKLVCACKDFATGGKRLLDFCSIKNTVLDSDSNGSGTEIADIMDAIEKQQYISPVELVKHFWNVFIIDTLLGNFDRHNGNWGFLYGETTGSVEIAPVYDCAGCLLPQADEKTILKVLSDEAELNARVFQFPTSAIKLNGRKINYYDFIHGGKNADCNSALLRMFPRIDLDQISAFIDRVDGISDLQKQFYKVYIRARYDRRGTFLYHTEGAFLYCQRERFHSIRGIICTLSTWNTFVPFGIMGIIRRQSDVDLIGLIQPHPLAPNQATFLQRRQCPLDRHFAFMNRLRQRFDRVDDKHMTVFIHPASVALG